jgi:hypothetical protein
VSGAKSKPASLARTLSTLPPSTKHKYRVVGGGGDVSGGLIVIQRCHLTKVNKDRPRGVVARHALNIVAVYAMQLRI